VELLHGLKKDNPQFNLDGERNIWIIKPCIGSCGRGITLTRNLEQIKKICGGDDNNNGGKYIVQKYIENPMIVLNRKFDIRQWVLVTSWNPLDVWMFTECYIRFPASDFSFNNMNKFAHLCNHAVSKHAKNNQFEHEIEGNMWSQDEL
jgi:tubulin monoglycylase TTLL3/8